MKIALLGYGKMGKEIEAIALQRGHSIVLKVDSSNAYTFTNDELKLAEVAIEFSTPMWAPANTIRCFNSEIPVVSGTTGWNEKLNDVKHIAKLLNQSFLYASNFSLGVNLFFELNKKLASLMKDYPEYEVSMKEIHHTQKLDAPSGTAISLAEEIIQNLSTKQKWVNQKSNNENEIGIESIRTEGVAGTHCITYTSAIDDIEIKHTAHNRKGFALGAVIAAEWLIDKKGVFDMKDVLGLNS
jgi:4-hydroxy-tetrahydrodipicolinate reductase